MQGAPTRTLPAIDWVSPPSGWPALICPPTTGVSISENIKQQLNIVNNEHQNSSTLSFWGLDLYHSLFTKYSLIIVKQGSSAAAFIKTCWFKRSVWRWIDLGSCSVPCGVYHCPSLQVSSSFHVIRFPCLAPETHPSSQIETECGLFMFTPKKISKE